MVRHLPHPGARREDMSKVALPLCRVRTLPETAHSRSVEYRLDATANPARRLGLLRPDGVENLDDQPGVDRRDRQLPQNRVHVSAEGITPLLAVLGVAPANFVTADEFLGHPAESSALGGGKPMCLPFSRPCGERVYPIVALLSMRQRLCARFCKRDIGIGSEPHIAAFAIKLKPEDP